MASPIFPPRLSNVHLNMVLPAVPSSVSTTMFNPQSFPPQQALGPSLAPSVAPPCTLPRVPQWPPFAQALVSQLATVPAGRGTKLKADFSMYAIFVFSQYPVTDTGVSIPGVRFAGHSFVPPGSSAYLPAAFSLGCCGARYPTRHSEISCCDCFGDVSRICWRSTPSLMRPRFPS